MTCFLLKHNIFAGVQNCSRKETIYPITQYVLSCLHFSMSATWSTLVLLETGRQWTITSAVMVYHPCPDYSVRTWPHQIWRTLNWRANYYVLHHPPMYRFKLSFNYFPKEAHSRSVMRGEWMGKYSRFSYINCINLDLFQTERSSYTAEHLAPFILQRCAIEINCTNFWCDWVQKWSHTVNPQVECNFHRI